MAIEIDKLRADLAAAQRELAAWKQAVKECSGVTEMWVTNRVAEILKDKQP